MGRAEPPLRASLDKLLELQEIDTERDRASRARGQLFAGLKQEGAAESAQRSAESAQRRAAEIQGSLKDAELQLASIESKIKTYEQRQRSGQVTSARDVGNVEREINQLVRQRAALDDKILRLMDEAEASRAAASEADALSTQSAHELATARDAQRTNLEYLDAQLARLGRERVGAAAAVGDEKLLQRYEALRAKPSTGGLAAARIEEMHCSGCHTQVSSMDADRVRNAEGVVLCETCGRILAAVAKSPPAPQDAS